MFENNIPHRDMTGPTLSARPSFATILNRGPDSLLDAWDRTAAAPEYIVLPKGKYQAKVVDGKLGQSSGGTRRYTLTFEIAAGPHTGRRVYSDHYLTDAALPSTKRDMAKLGITSPAQFDGPPPRGYVCEIDVVIHTADDGDSRNKVKTFRVVRRDTIDDPLFGTPTAPAQPDRTGDDGATGVTP